MKARFSWFGYSDDPGERRQEVKFQIRSKRLHMENGRDARLELQRGRGSVHRRSADEYRHPERELRMSTWDTARSISVDDDRPFEDKPLSWMGVRGTPYTDPRRWFYTPGRWFEVWGELVPEPMNAHDEFALAIDLDGVRLGYAPARYARYAHGYVSALNNLGDCVLVPLKYRSDYARDIRTLIASALVALPTFNEFNKLLPTDEEYGALFAPVWEALGENVRLEIAHDRFHLTEHTLAEIIALRHLAPELGIPELPRLQAVPRGIDYFLQQRRYEAHRAAAQERKLRDEKIVAAFQDGWRQIDVARQLGVSPSVVSTALRNAGVDTRAPRVDPEQRRTNEEIIRMVGDGRTRREIIDALGVSAHAISKAAAAAGVSVRSEARVNDYARAKMRERLAQCRRAIELKQSGLTRREVAAQLGASDDGTKGYLADGKFFNDPSSNPDRLNSARAVRARGITQSQASGRSERRAIGDANMLDLIAEPWN